jgi:predicted DNA-binding protein (MmcQ/YjbR family)
LNPKRRRATLAAALQMDNETVRSYCLSFPHVTEEVLWGADLVFKIGGKMFTVIGLDAGSDHRMSFKATPEKFAELIERNGIVPAPYVAKYHWVALERFNALSEKELKTLIRTAYDLVFEKLPKKAKLGLEKGESQKPNKRR